VAVRLCWHTLGTSAFHGSAYEFVRTENTDANLYFNKPGRCSADPRSLQQLRLYGRRPIFIPRVYNADRKKTFFFWSEEWRKTSQPTTNYVPAATPAELAGQFFSKNQVSAPAGCITGWTPFNPTTLTGGVGTVNLNTPGCVSQNASVYLSQIVSKFQANVTAVNPATGYTDAMSSRPTPR